MQSLVAKFLMCFFKIELCPSFRLQYAVRTPEGRIHWMERGELDSINPNRHRLLEGDLARVISSGHDHSFLHRGDLVEILKIIEEVDYYKVLIEDELHWLNGLELAAYQ